jgi:MerR family transcriptional regulator, thiopeptide resistance regulator
VVIYAIKKLADLAGISVRTRHYDEVGLLRPGARTSHGYRCCGEDEDVRLQQILFFRELGFGLEEIKKILSRPDFDVLDPLQSHQTLLIKKAERIRRLLLTAEKTINSLKGELKLDIKEYYQGFSNDQIERYRQEVRRRWGDKTLKESELRVKRMGKQRFADVQAEGGRIFQTICDNMSKGFESHPVQEQVARWRQWLENFHHYSDQEVLGLGRLYSQSKEFSEFFGKYDKDLAGFLTKAIERHYSRPEF